MSTTLGIADVLRLASTVQRLIGHVESGDFAGIAASTLELTTMVLQLGPDEALAPYLTEEDRKRIDALVDYAARVKLGPRPVPLESTTLDEDP